MTRIAGWGHAVPPVVATSAELETRLGLPAGWVEQRYGVVSRRLAGPDQATSDLAVVAVLKLFETPEANAPGSQSDCNNDSLISTRLRAGGVSLRSHGLLILATSTPDHPLPPTAPLVAQHCGLKGWGAIDLAGACSGFIYALSFGHNHCKATGEPVIVVAANVLSRRVNPNDPATAAIFADGAGALLITPDGDDCLKSVAFSSDGSRYDSIRVAAGGSRSPTIFNGTRSVPTTTDHYMHMERGPEVFRSAVQSMIEVGREAMDKAKVNKIDWWIPHQANERLIREVGKRLQIPESKTLMSLKTWGNASAASIPLTLSLAMDEGRIAPGDTILLTAAGAGMISAGAVLRM